MSYRIGSTLASAGHNVTVVLIASFKDRDISTLTVPIGINGLPFLFIFQYPFSVKRIDANIGKTRQEADKDMSEIMYEALPEGHPKLKKFFSNFMNTLTATCKSTLPYPN